MASKKPPAPPKPLKIDPLEAFIEHHINQIKVDVQRLKDLNITEDFVPVREVEESDIIADVPVEEYDGNDAGIFYYH